VVLCTYKGRFWINPVRFVTKHFVYGKRSSLQKDESIEYLNESFVVGEDFRFENGMTLELRMDVGQVEEGLVESDVKLLLHPEHKGVVSEYTINVVQMSYKFNP
jgi:hypothetical protein